MASEPSPHARQRVLVIDDEEVVRETCRRIFEEEGYEVLLAGRPDEGIALARSSRPDVVLCDWQLPGMDGEAVVEALERQLPDLPVVMITGYPSIDRARAALQKGALDFVCKPFTPEEITSAARKAMARGVEREKKAVGRLAALLSGGQFPVPSLDDQAPGNIAETVASKIGPGKATSPWLSVFVLGLLAGAYIGFGGLLSTAVSFDLTPRFGLGLSRLVAGAAFSLGLMLVVIAGAELFTGNNLMVSSVLSRHITWGVMAKRWLLVFVANFLGSLVLALLFYASDLWRGAAGGGAGGSGGPGGPGGPGIAALGQAAVAIAYRKANLEFLPALVRGIGCNWLVCLAVWMALASRQTIGKIFAIFFPILAFVAIGFEHCVANMYFLPVGMMLVSWGGVPAPAGFDPGSLNLLSFLWGNLVPVTLGNILGGAVFVGMGYWGAYLRPARGTPG